MEGGGEIWKGGIEMGGGADEVYEVSWMYAPRRSAVVSRRTFIIHEGWLEKLTPQWNTFLGLPKYCFVLVQGRSPPCLIQSKIVMYKPSWHLFPSPGLTTCPPLCSYIWWKCNYERGGGYIRKAGGWYTHDFGNPQMIAIMGNPYVGKIRIFLLFNMFCSCWWFPKLLANSRHFLWFYDWPRVCIRPNVLPRLWDTRKLGHRHAGYTSSWGTWGTWGKTRKLKRWDRLEVSALNIISMGSC